MVSPHTSLVLSGKGKVSDSEIMIVLSIGPLESFITPEYFSSTVSNS